MRTVYIFCFAWLLCSSFFILEGALSIESEVIDLKSLVADVKNSELMLKSSRGYFTIKPTVTEFGEKALGRKGAALDPVEHFFAFQGKKVLCEQLSGIRHGQTAIFDGEKQIEIDKTRKPHTIAIRGSLKIYPRSRIRYWGLLFSQQPVGKYLEEYGIAIQGKEYTGDTLCYVVRAKHPRMKEIKFWIAPSKGYRVLKREYNTSYQSGVQATVTMIVQYEKTKDGTWFPKSGEDTVIGLNKETGKQELIQKYALTVKDSEVNIDVSDLFSLDIPPETMVWDHRIGRKRPAKEAGIYQEGRE